MNHHTLIPITAPIDEVDDAPLRRFWWLRRIFWVTALFIVFVIGSWFWLRHRAQRRLAGEIQQWKKEGLPIDDKDFEQPPVPDEENAAVAFNRAVHGLVDMTAWDKADNADDFFQHPWSAQTLAFADQTAAVNHKALEELRAARELTKVHWDLMRLRNLRSSRLSQHRVDLSSIRTMANLIRVTAITAHLREDEAAFLEYLHDLQWIAEITARKMTTGSSLVAGGIDGLAATMIGELSSELRLDTPALRAETRARMSEWLIPDRLQSRWEPTAHEGKSLLETLDDVNELAVLQSERTSDSPWLQVVAWHFMEPLRIQQVFDTLRYTRGSVHAARQPNWPAASKELSMHRLAVPLLTGVEPLATLSKDVFLSTYTHDQYLEILFHHDRRVRVGVLHLACRLYSIDHHGKNPATLSELVPDYLPAIPVDPLSANGQVFRLHSATMQPFIYGLGVSSDLVASGAWLPTPAQHEDPRSDIFVSFLNPYPKAAASQPSTRSAQ